MGQYAGLISHKYTDDATAMTFDAGWEYTKQLMSNSRATQLKIKYLSKMTSEQQNDFLQLAAEAGLIVD